MSERRHEYRGMGKDFSGEPCSFWLDHDPENDEWLLTIFNLGRVEAIYVTLGKNFPFKGELKQDALTREAMETLFDKCLWMS